MELKTYDDKPETWRYILDTIVFGGYLISILFCFNWFNSGSAEYPHSCGAANGMLVLLTLAAFGVAFFYFFISAILSNGYWRRYRWMALVFVVFFPIFLIWIA